MMWLFVAVACLPPPGRSVHDPDDDFDGDGLDENHGDCDDADAEVGGPALWYADRDGDGRGDPGSEEISCEADADKVSTKDDCDDTRADIFPGATDPCDDLDAACDGVLCEPGLLGESDALFAWEQGPDEAGVVSFAADGPGGRPVVGVGASSRINRTPYDTGARVTFLIGPAPLVAQERGFPDPKSRSFLWPAGDMSNDGVTDWLASSTCYSTECEDADTAWLLDGSNLAGPIGDETALVGTDGDCLGVAAAPVGASLAISSPCGAGGAGVVFLVPSGTLGAVVDLTEVPSMLGDLSLSGPGITMASGDLSGDGTDDLALGTFGSLNGLEALLVEDAEVQPVASLLDAVRYGSYIGPTTQAGAQVAFLPSPSGFDRLAVGAPGDVTLGGGSVYFIAVPLDGWLPDSPIAVVGPRSFGGAVSAVGDVDGDGIVDLAIGAPDDDDEDPFASMAGGTAYVVSGADISGYGTMEIDDIVLVKVRGEPGAHLGVSLAGGDLDGDGAGDLIVGQDNPLLGPAALVFSHLLRDPP